MDRLLTGGDLEQRRLATDREAMRRVAALVAAGGEPAAVFDAVTDELRRCVPASHAGLCRFEAGGATTLLSLAGEPASLAKYEVGTRTPVDGDTLGAVVYRTGRPARLDTYENVSGSSLAHVRAVGVRSAVGVPIIVDGRVWGLAAVGSTQSLPMPVDTEDRIGVFADLSAAAIVAGYRGEHKRRLLGEEPPRPALMDLLLIGRMLDRWGVWEIADRLLLPSRGPFVVVAAEAPAVGEAAMPEIASMLRSLDVYSAWHMLPDLQVGVVHMKSGQHLDKVLDLLARATAGRIGVSAPFDDLRDAPQAFHVAKVTLRNGRSGADRVAVFDGSILATAAISVPEVMVKLVRAVFDGFDDFGEEERELLFETFRVWQQSDGSVRDTAEALVCHPNTVRYRLRRIEQRTGRSLSRPRDIAELCLAFEVQRRLM
jgi:PucR C-terminal helix-turn-helix domain/GGDEF-like domain/GAF domain